MALGKKGLFNERQANSKLINYNQEFNAFIAVCIADEAFMTRFNKYPSKIKPHLSHPAPIRIINYCCANIPIRINEVL
jgi:hypothetical protein